VFTAPLLNNARGEDHRKHCSSVVARIRFRGNVFAEPLPSNRLFRFLDVMLQYIYMYVLVKNPLKFQREFAKSTLLEKYLTSLFPLWQQDITVTGV
jgi:hypothetical protein